MKSVVIDNYADFKQLADEWNALVERSSVEHVYMRHEWFDHWIRANQVESQLAIVTLRDGDELVGIAPLRRTKFVYRGIKAKGLRFLSSPIAPRCNFIVSDSKYLEPLLDCVFGLDDWDVLFMENLEQTNETTQAYLKLMDQRFVSYPSQVLETLRSPYLVTKGTFDNYWDSLPKKRVKFLERMCYRRLEKAGSYSFGKIETREQWEAFLPSMFVASEKSWKGMEGTELRHDQPGGRLYLSFTPLALERDWVSITTLSIDEKIIGFEYLLKYGNSYALTRSDFDVDYKYYSPGNNIRLRILEDLFDRPETCEYDLCGDDYPYKLEWTDQIRPHVEATVGNRTMRGRAILLAKNVILPTVRRLTGHPDSKDAGADNEA
jgi:CelD/BcsL family acetyltransferase involved in cellulose biosynthesis